MPDRPIAEDLMSKRTLELFLPRFAVVITIGGFLSIILHGFASYQDTWEQVPGFVLMAVVNAAAWTIISKETHDAK